MDSPLISPDKPVFPISAVALHLKINQHTLRIYEQKKILCPQRSAKNRRLYSFNDIKKGEVIRYLTKNQGVNPAGVRITLKLLEKLKVSTDNYEQTIEEIDLKYDLNKQK